MRNTILKRVLVFILGILFAFGLGFGGMLDPQVVRGFLTLNHDWNSTLLWVMIGAIPVYFFFAQMQMRMRKPLLEDDWQHLPKTGWNFSFEAKAGAALFGLGWGLSGYCPGPAIVSLASLQIEAIVFVASMIVGMFLWGRFHLLRARGLP